MNKDKKKTMLTRYNVKETFIRHVYILIWKYVWLVLNINVLQKVYLKW